MGIRGHVHFQHIYNHLSSRHGNNSKVTLIERGVCDSLFRLTGINRMGSLRSRCSYTDFRPIFRRWTRLYSLDDYS